MDSTDRIEYAQLYHWLHSPRANDTRWDILTALKGTDTITAKELATLTGLSRSTLDNHLRTLDEFDTIERKGNPTTIHVTTELIDQLTDDLR